MAPEMATASPVNRTWITSELVKLLEIERALADGAKARADSPPDPSLGVVYREIAAADERHAAAVETIATRYGHTPARGVGGGVGEALGRLKEKVGELGSGPLDRLARDLAAKAEAIHWLAAWVGTLEALGDAASARELAAVLAEEQRHRDALQAGLNRLVEVEARGAGDTPK
jgi:hypothetical protein